MIICQLLNFIYKTVNFVFFQQTSNILKRSFDGFHVLDYSSCFFFPFSYCLEGWPKIHAKIQNVVGFSGPFLDVGFEEPQAHRRSPKASIGPFLTGRSGNICRPP